MYPALSWAGTPQALWRVVDDVQVCIVIGFRFVLLMYQKKIAPWLSDASYPGKEGALLTFPVHPIRPRATSSSCDSNMSACAYECSS